MTKDKEVEPLKFEDIDDILYRRRGDVVEKITDYRLCAGLLFERWNDGTLRILRTSMGEPRLRISMSGGDFSSGEIKEIPVDADVVKKLLEERLVEGTPQMGYTDKTELRLSQHGKRQIVEDIFSGDVDFCDFMKAGAKYRDGEFHWE